MDTASLHKSLDQNHQNQIILWTRSLDLGAKASAWVLAANATALVLCFNAALQSENLDWSLLRLLGLIFFFGVATAFVSVLCEQKSFGEYSAKLSLFIAKGTNAINLLEQKRLLEEMLKEAPGAQIEAAAESVRAELETLSDDMQSFDFNGDAEAWGIASNITMTLGCIALGIGVTAALWLFPG